MLVTPLGTEPATFRLVQCLNQLRNPVTPSGTEPVTFRLVQCLNQLPDPVPARSASTLLKILPLESRVT